MSEDEIQIEVVKRLRAAGVAFFHVANERRTSPRQGAKLKAMGVSAGVPDLIIVCPEQKPPAVVDAAMARYPGCRTFALELKADRGRLSEPQRAWLDTMSSAGWEIAVTYGLTEAVDQLTDWGLL